MLSFDNLFNIHSVEFQAWDIHSGLKSIQWRLYDNYTNPDTTHVSGALPVDDSVASSNYTRHFNTPTKKFLKIIKFNFHRNI